VKPAGTQAQMQNGSCVVLGDACFGESLRVVSVAHFRPQDCRARATRHLGSGSPRGRSLR
jgi:hypothetical protein